jgi:tetratricopeptide (TPR) repeat protein
LGGIFTLLGFSGTQNREKIALLTQAVDLLRRVEPTQENQRALGLALGYLGFSLAMTGLREAALPLAKEGLSLLRRVSKGRALALGHLLAAYSGVAEDEMHAKPLFEQALAIAHEADALLEACWALGGLAQIAIRLQEYDQAKEHSLAFLRLAREIGHRRGEAISLGVLGQVAYIQGQYVRARAFHEQSLAISRELGDRIWMMRRLNALGEVALAARDLEQAKARYREALSSAEELAALRHITTALCGLGEVALAAGDVPAARQHYRRALQVAMEVLRADVRRQTLVSVAKWYANQEQRALAVELVALALGTSPDYWRETLRDTEALLSELRSGLSPDIYAAAEARGQARDLEATMAELLAEL